MHIIYAYRFAVACPNNRKQIEYTLTIESDHMIQVEKIVIACQFWQEQYHEKLAEHLAYQFPRTKQTLMAHHHGVDIKTVCQ